MDIWNYEKNIWLSYNKNGIFNKLPVDIIKYIIDLLIPNFKLLKNRNNITNKIENILINKRINFHLDKTDINYDIHEIKYILKDISEKLNIRIKISHICCNGKGIHFDYENCNKKIIKIL